MSFPKAIVEQAFMRQNGLCAHCGKPLVLGNRDRQAWGSWHAHHRTNGGGDSIRNCLVLCTGLPDQCHLMVGHGGGLSRRATILDSDLPYLHAAPSSDKPYPAGAYGF